MVEYIETGLFDCDGKEIESNDIVSFDYGIGIVFWNKTTASFGIEFDTDTDSLWLHLHLMKVIGNFKDEPENCIKDAIHRLNRETNYGKELSA